LPGGENWPVWCFCLGGNPPEGDSVVGRTLDSGRTMTEYAEVAIVGRGGRGDGI